MGKMVLKDAKIEIDGVDVSHHLSHVEIEERYDEVEVTSFGGSREFIKGLSETFITLGMRMNEAAAKLTKAAENAHKLEISVPTGGSANGLWQVTTNVNPTFRSTDYSRQLCQLMCSPVYNQPNGLWTPGWSGISRAPVRTLAAKAERRAIENAPNEKFRAELRRMFELDRLARERGVEMHAKNVGTVEDPLFQPIYSELATS